jgi:hypothetical protein
MVEDRPGGGLRLISTVVALVLLGSGLVVGFWPVSGAYDSESFSCGSALLGTADDGGYGGTREYEECDRERTHLRWIALSNLTLGVVLLGGVVWSARREPKVHRAGNLRAS